jgi:hypothetical protein
MKTYKVKDLIVEGGSERAKARDILRDFGEHLQELTTYTDERFHFALVGQTKESVKKDMCEVLSDLFGEDFRYDYSRKTSRDAVLFGHSLHIVGLKGPHSEAYIRGLAGIAGITHNEVDLCSEEQFELLTSRIRGVKLPIAHSAGYLGMTNPDLHSTHWIHKKAEQGAIRLIK